MKWPLRRGPLRRSLIVRPVLKRGATQTIHCAPAPAGVIEGSEPIWIFVC